MNSNIIKLLCMVFMTMDHYAYMFLGFRSPQYQIFRFFGRMVAPVMCYFLAEGYVRSSSFRKYLTRMLIYAFIAYVPYILMSNPRYLIGQGRFDWLELNMLFTQAICLVMLKGIDYVNEHHDGDILLRNLVIAAAVLMTHFSDWNYFAPLWVANYYLNRDDEKTMWQYFLLIGLGVSWYSCSGILERYGLVAGARYCFFTLGTFVSGLLIKLYDHKRGKLNIKHFFYLYYPAHICVLVYLKYLSLR